MPIWNWNLPSFTSGSVPFGAASGVLAQDNTNFFWDNVNKRLGIGTAVPATVLQVSGNAGGLAARVDTSNASFGPTVNIVSTALGGRDWRLGSGQTGNSAGQGKFFIFDATVNSDRLVIDTSGNVGIGTAAPGAQFNVTSAIEIFQTATLTAGSLGSLICPLKTAVGVPSDAEGGNLNAAFLVSSGDNKLYARAGGLWKGVAIAGFSIPNYRWKPVDTNGRRRYVKSNGRDETVCPLCRRQMRPGDALGMYADKWYNLQDSKEGLHAVACHLSCAKKTIRKE